MKFLLDVCASSRSMYLTLTGLGHDVISAIEIDPSAADEELLALAAEERRILITEDKDFGELVFVHSLPHPCIIRFLDMPVAEKAAAMMELLQHHEDDITADAIIVVTRGRIRIRRSSIDH